MEKVSAIQTAIEDIIIDNTYPAKEIADIQRRFARWCITDVGYTCNNWKPMYVCIDTDEKFKSIDELFSYWNDNINK